MTDYSIAADTIIQSVTALQVADKLGIRIDRHGRCQCPFHHGQDCNLKLYDGNRGYHCFVCGKTGTVISFVMDYYGIRFREALEWLNEAFGLGIDISSRMSPETLREAKERQRQRQLKAEQKRWVKMAQFEMSLLAGQFISAFEDIRDKNIPTEPDGPWNDDFCRSIVGIRNAHEFAEECMINCTEWGEK